MKCVSKQKTNTPIVNHINHPEKSNSLGGLTDISSKSLLSMTNVKAIASKQIFLEPN